MQNLLAHKMSECETERETDREREREWVAASAAGNGVKSVYGRVQLARKQHHQLDQE